MTTAKDAFLLHLEQPAELVALSEYDSLWYAIWTRPTNPFRDRPFNVSVFTYDEALDRLHLMRSSDYDLSMVDAMTLVADLMRGVTI